MERVYFTFGTNPHFPYGINEFVVSEGIDYEDAVRKFREKYPHKVNPNVVNCAFIYTEEEFNRFRDKYYKDVEPSEIIR